MLPTVKYGLIDLLTSLIYTEEIVCNINFGSCIQYEVNGTTLAGQILDKTLAEDYGSC